MTVLFKKLLYSLCGVTLFASVGFAQDPCHGDFEKEVAAVRLKASPVLDGRLSPSEWTGASIITDLHQLRPVDHGTPSQKTVIHVAYDDDFLYVAAELIDSDPSKIVANQMVQGGSTHQDDAFKVYLGPFNNNRSGYIFKVNPNAVRNEGIFVGGTMRGVDMNWQGIWNAKTSRNAKGWVAEIAIPFKSLSFNPNSDTWGISFGRDIGLSNERIAWTSYNRRTKPDSLGELVGINDIKQGLGLDINAEMSFGHTKDYEAGTNSMELRPSVDIFYKITPALTAVLTANTDFSAADVDDQVVNLSRFSVFLPEKRDFFLQDSDMFRFGNIFRNGKPFFSRRIGLDEDNQPVDLKVGIKLAGRIGNWNVGVLDVMQERGDHEGDANLFVGRVSYNLLEDSSIGALMTYGDPITGEGSYTVGTDLSLKSKNLIQGKQVILDAWIQKTNTEGLIGKDMAYGGRLTLKAGDGFDGLINYLHIEDNFAPALGFTNIENVNDYYISMKYAYRPLDSWFYQATTEFKSDNIFEIGGGLISRNAEWDVLKLQNEVGDEVSTGYKYIREVLSESYEIVEGVIIPVGDYDFSSGYLKFKTASQRKVSLEAEIEKGQFYDGTRTRIKGRAQIRPTKKLKFSVSATHNNAHTPFGDFKSLLYSVGSDVAFTTDWSWITRLQYDNISQEGGVNSRLRYNPEPGQNFYIVVNHGFFVDEDGRRRSSINKMIAKLGYTFRF